MHLFGILCLLSTNVGATSWAYPFHFENKRGHEVTLQFSRYQAEDAARAGAEVDIQGASEVLKLRPGDRKRFLTVESYPWIRWCQIEPKSSLPCEILHIHGTIRMVVLE